MSIIPRRLLITGSRSWTNWDIIYYALAAEWAAFGPDTILVSGHCPQGADSMCEHIWRSWSGLVETHPAQWSTYGKSAGFRRNTEMAALPGVYKCVAFQLDGSNGTAHCMGEARKLGVPVNLYELRS
jgi:YspA, cpYpsA-related SLOG family